jgi:hypothetical protein
MEHPMFAVQQYDYNIKIWVMLVVICIFGFAMVGMSFVALGNDQGLILDSIINLPAVDATGVYWICVVACFCGVCMGLYGIYFAMTVKRVIIMSATEISAPPSQYAKINIIVSFGAITNIYLKKTMFQQFLHIHYGAAKLRLSSSLFRDMATFQDFLIVLRTACSSMS